MDAKVRDAEGLVRNFITYNRDGLPLSRNVPLSILANEENTKKIYIICYHISLLRAIIYPSN